MHLLDHHPCFPGRIGSRDLAVSGLSDEAVAATAHVVGEVLVFVALDGDVFRVGQVNSFGVSKLYPEPAAIPQLTVTSIGFGYLCCSGRVCVVDLRSDLVCFIPAESATGVALSDNLAWGAVRDREATIIWSLPTCRQIAKIEGQILAISDEGVPQLSIDMAKEILDSSTIVKGVLSLRDTIDVNGRAYAFFDSMYGTAVLWKVDAIDAPELIWIPGRWVLGAWRDANEVVLGLQRLGQIEQITLEDEVCSSNVYSPERQQFKFQVEWVSSHDDTLVPVSRFRSLTNDKKWSLVTVHGGFGISLRPFSGMPQDVRFSGDIIYAHVRGGGELGKTWAAAGRGSLKSNSLADLISVLRHENKTRRTGLIGTSHGGWLSVLAALMEPNIIDRLCVTSPIVCLRSYLASPLGQKYRSEFPEEEEIDMYDPIILIERVRVRNLPSLMIICGDVDATVLGQRTERFAQLWKNAGGSCEVIHHAGGHYSPSANDIERVKNAQASFFELNR